MPCTTPLPTSPDLRATRGRSNASPASLAMRASGRASGEEYAAIYARTRCPVAREKVVIQFRGLVEMLAAKMCRRGVAAEDLVQVGTIGLIQALDRFDPERGVKFATYAVNTVVGEIKHYFRDCTWSVKVPRQLQEVAYGIRRLNEEINRETGQNPTILMLAQRMGHSEETIVEAMELETVYAPYSLDAFLGQDDAEHHERLADVLGIPDLRLERIVTEEPLNGALDRLEPRKRWILSRRYFDDWSQNEVGRALGISQMHVSRLEREALTEVRSWIGAVS